jgi:hypothetical protein
VRDATKWLVGYDEPDLVSGAGLCPWPWPPRRSDSSSWSNDRMRLARHGVNRGTKVLTVVGSMLLLGGDSVPDTAL